MGFRDSMPFLLEFLLSRSLCSMKGFMEKDVTYWQEPHEIPEGQVPVSAPAGDSPWQWHSLGPAWMRPALWESSWWSASWTEGSRCALAAREATSCTTRSMARRLRAKNSLEYSIHISDPQFRNDIAKLEWV